jgi:hypothetical protein
MHPEAEEDPLDERFGLLSIVELGVLGTGIHRLF